MGTIQEEMVSVRTSYIFPVPPYTDGWCSCRNVPFQFARRDKSTIQINSNLADNKNSHYFFCYTISCPFSLVASLSLRKGSYSCSFSRQGIADASIALLLWLNENVHFYARFLAMPKLMQAWFWSFGLTKTLEFLASRAERERKGGRLPIAVAFGAALLLCRLPNGSENRPLILPVIIIISSGRSQMYGVRQKAIRPPCKFTRKSIYYRADARDI